MTHCFTGGSLSILCSTNSQTELGKDGESATHTGTAAPAFHNGEREEQRNVDYFSTKCFTTISVICFLCNKEWSPLTVKPVKISNLPSACLHELETHMQVLFILFCRCDLRVQYCNDCIYVILGLLDAAKNCKRMTVGFTFSSLGHKPCSGILLALLRSKEFKTGIFMALTCEHLK